MSDRAAFQVPVDRPVLTFPDATVTFREIIAALRFLVTSPFVRGRLVTVTFPGAGTDTRVVHGLTSLAGWVMTRDSAGVRVYSGTAGGQPGTSNLRATGAATVTLWVF